MAETIKHGIVVRPEPGGTPFARITLDAAIESVASGVFSDREGRGDGRPALINGKPWRASRVARPFARIEIGVVIVSGPRAFSPTAKGVATE